jgi:hypothetical protein
MRRFFLLAATALAVAAPAPATAAETETPIADVLEAAPVAVHGDTVVWNHYDAATKQFTLRLKSGGAEPRDLPVPASASPFDIDLGVGPDEEPSLVYSVCADEDCDVWILEDLQGFQPPERVRSATTPGRNETSPSIHGNTVYFVSAKSGQKVPDVRSVTVHGTHRLRTLRALPTRMIRANATVTRFTQVAAYDLEARNGRLLLVWSAPKGDGNVQQVLYLKGPKARWRGLARASSGALSSAEFHTPAFAQGGRAVFAFIRRATGAAPRLVSVRLSGDPAPLERLFAQPMEPVAIDAAADDVVMLRKDQEMGTCTADPAGKPLTGPGCHVVRIDGVEYRQAKPEGYSIN